jgi:hypothetical protein
MPPLLTLAAAAAFIIWLFIVLPRLKGHLDPWEREYDIAYQAFERSDYISAEQHLCAAYELAGDSAETRETVAAELAKVRAKLGPEEQRPRPS